MIYWSIAQFLLQIREFMSLLKILWCQMVVLWASLLMSGRIIQQARKNLNLFKQFYDSILAFLTYSSHVYPQKSIVLLPLLNRRSLRITSKTKFEE